MSEQELEVNETELDGTAENAAVTADESEVDSAAPETADVDESEDADVDDESTSEVDEEDDSEEGVSLESAAAAAPADPAEEFKPSCAARKVTGTSSTPTQATRTA